MMNLDDIAAEVRSLDGVAAIVVHERLDPDTQQEMASAVRDYLLNVGLWPLPIIITGVPVEFLDEEQMRAAGWVRAERMEQ